MYWIIDLFVIYNSGFYFCSSQVSKVSLNPGKVHLEVLVHLLSYIRDNKTLVLKYYAGMKDAPLSDLRRQARTKSGSQLMFLMILVGKIVQTLAEVQAHIFYVIKVGQLTMAHMFQDQFINQVQKRE